MIVCVLKAFFVPYSWYEEDMGVDDLINVEYYNSIMKVPITCNFFIKVILAADWRFIWTA